MCFQRPWANTGNLREKVELDRFRQVTAKPTDGTR